jgi:hypothetical protein
LVLAGLVSTVLVALWVGLAAAAPGGSGRFVDDDGNIHEDAIEAVAEAGITKGCNPPINDMYCPAAVVTRGQMAAFLVRALGLTDDGGGNSFVDDDGSVFELDIAKLAAAGITKGCDPPINDMFCPNDPVTRGQMAAFLVRGFGYAAGLGADLFVDDDDSVFELDIDRLGTAGVTRGCNPPVNDMYCPTELVRRDQMASFLARAAGLPTPPVTTTSTTVVSSSSTSSTSSSTTSTPSTTTTTTTTSTLPPPDCETTTDAVAYWCFDDEVSPTDDGADGHDATVDGAAWETSDLPPVPDNVAALRFDGTDDHARAADPGGSNNLDGFSAITLSAWINPDGDQAGNGCCGGIVTKYGSGALVSYGLDVAGDELRFVYVGDEFSTIDLDLVAGEWIHVAGTWDGSDVRLYANGVQVAFGDDRFATIPDTGINVNIGSFEAFASGNRAGFFDGMIDEVYIFDRVLTPAEIAQLAGLEATETWHVDLVMQWNQGIDFSKFGLRWTPGLGFDTTDLGESCASLAGSWTPAPQDFPYDIIDVTYDPGVIVRYDFAFPLRPVQAWLHDGDTCNTPDGQGGGLPADIWFFEFDTLP